MAIGDSLSKDKKKSLFLPDGLVVGTVIRKHVIFTDPPKIKFLVVVGIHDNRVQYATTVINSKINYNIAHNEYLVSHHIELSHNDCDFLEHSSFVDCSELIEDTLEGFNAAFDKSPEIACGHMPRFYLDQIMRTIIHSDIIKGKICKRYGMFDYVFTNAEAAE